MRSYPGRHVLNPAQQEVMDHGLLESGFSVILQMPTGTGKTWLAAQGIRQSVERGHRAIYLSPLRALAEELAERWTQEFDPHPVGIFTGDYGASGRKAPVSFDKARVLVMTPERLDACTRHWRSHWAWIPEVDLVVVDEVHLLGDPNRGARLEGAISRLRRLNPFARFLGLSATLGNRGEIADWLDGVEFSSSWRSVPLHWRVERFKKAQEKPALLVREAAEVARQGLQSIVFVQSRRRSEALARFLLDQGLQAQFHHAGLGHDRRREVERAFRENRTPILIATGTLEMGLNLPARQVVLYDLQGFGGTDFCPLSVSTVWQRAGRAGRPGLDTCGEAVLFAPTWDRAAEQYLRGQFEPIRSSLAEPAHLEEQILVEVHSGLACSESQLTRLLDRSLAVAQGYAPPFRTAIQSMTDAGLLRLDDESDRFVVTPLGRIATRQMLRPASILQLQETLRRTDAPTDFDLLVGICLAEDCEPVLAVDFEELETFAEQLAHVRTNAFRTTKSLPASGKRLLSAFRMALALLEWTRTGDADVVAEAHGCYPFEIRRLCESAERLLLALAAVQRIRDKATHGDDGAVEPSLTVRRIELLRQMVINGLPERVATLSFVDGIGPKWARKLTDAGIDDLKVLAAASPSDLVRLGGVSDKRATAWIEAARDRATQAWVGEPSSSGTLRIHPLRWDFPHDPYRLRRSLELTVEWLEDGAVRVSGGLEPHRLISVGDAWRCDCRDFSKGATCKHILAVHREAGDPLLLQAVQQMRSLSEQDYLDLIQLWFQR